MTDLIHRLLSRPIQVLVAAGLFGAVAVVLDGSLFKYWNLKATERQLDARVSKVLYETEQLRTRIQQTRSLTFLERQAREHLDMIGPDEIVFVFADEP